MKERYAEIRSRSANCVTNLLDVVRNGGGGHVREAGRQRRGDLRSRMPRFQPVPDGETRAIQAERASGSCIEGVGASSALDNPDFVPWLHGSHCLRFSDAQDDSPVLPAIVPIVSVRKSETRNNQIRARREPVILAAILSCRASLTVTVAFDSSTFGSTSGCVQTREYRAAAHGVC